MINLDIKKIVSAIKIIDVDTKIFAKKIIVILIFEVNNNNIYIKIALINQNIIILFKIIILKLKIWCLEIIIFF